MKPRRIVYFSKARDENLDQDISDILSVARDRNAREGITGLLLHMDGVYAQVLEGDHDALESVMASIEKDERHSDIVFVSDEAVDSRRFNDWSMAFLDTDSSDLMAAAGFGGVEDAMAAMRGDGSVPKAVIDGALERFKRRLDPDKAASA